MSGVVQITDRPEHDRVVEESKKTPTVIYVSNSSLPTCRAYTPQYEELAKRRQDTGVRFAQMEFNTNTSMLFKFSPNQLPVTVLMVRDAWCKTVMGPDMKGLESALETLIEEAKKGGEL
jgi:thioredoxin-like negative regulator of GroEL